MEVLCIYVRNKFLRELLQTNTVIRGTLIEYTRENQIEL